MTTDEMRIAVLTASFLLLSDVYPLRAQMLVGVNPPGFDAHLL
jgi:hypothetical protein